ncbi:AAA family ATPase [Acinetobacter baumannii]|nr:AAA family ATPase [Acinetobacter baumannii]
MKIKKLSVKYHPTGIEIQQVEFDETLSLLVGISGVGKTRILNAIQDLIFIANGKSINGMEWDAEFELNNKNYYWKGAFEYKEENPFEKIAFLAFRDKEKSQKESINILYEKLYIDNHAIVERDTKNLVFKTEKLPAKLSLNESSLSLLEEPEILSFLQELRRIKIVHDSNYSRTIHIETSKNIGLLENENTNIKDIRNIEDCSIFFKLFLLQEKCKDIYDEFCLDYRSIFPYVEDIKIDRFILSTKDNASQFVISIKETGVDEWIPQNLISTGMLKTLCHLAYTYLSSEGTIFLIDEFENGFGINCINSISEKILYSGENYQYIITSHHPYIINKIPLRKWKIINRDKKVIKSFEALRYIDSSKHDAFIKLINSDLYTKGISIIYNNDDITEDDLYS